MSEVSAPWLHATLADAAAEEEEQKALNADD